MLKVSHTLFALPFALASMLAAAGGLPPAKIILLIVLAMFFARNAGMSFNRYLDAEIDARNPRTAARHVPRGIFSKPFVLVFALANAALFVLITYEINSICFSLSPIALLLLFGYSFMKRLTSLSHLFLGMVLGAAPVAAWMAIRGNLSVEPVLLAAGVMFWVAGFDVIYATQDYDFDKKEGLHSLVVRLGIPNALNLSRLFHVLTLGFFVSFGVLLKMPWGYFIALLLIAGFLIYEHSLVKAGDLSRVNAAFFTANGFVSLIFLAGVVLSIIE